MWLGKALSLKGDVHQDQVLQEYREGVRVLEQSKIDRGSSSMALFRWYLGTALLETGKVCSGSWGVSSQAETNISSVLYKLQKAEHMITSDSPSDFVTLINRSHFGVLSLSYGLTNPLSPVNLKRSKRP